MRLFDDDHAGPTGSAPPGGAQATKPSTQITEGVADVGDLPGRHRARMAVARSLAVERSPAPSPGRAGRRTRGIAETGFIQRSAKDLQRWGVWSRGLPV